MRVNNLKQLITKYGDLPVSEIITKIENVYTKKKERQLQIDEQLKIKYTNKFVLFQPETYCKTTKYIKIVSVNASEKDESMDQLYTINGSIIEVTEKFGLMLNSKLDHISKDNLNKMTFIIEEEFNRAENSYNKITKLTKELL